MDGWSTDATLVLMRLSKVSDKEIVEIYHHLGNILKRDGLL